VGFSPDRRAQELLNAHAEAVMRILERERQNAFAADYYRARDREKHGCEPSAPGIGCHSDGDEREAFVEPDHGPAASMDTKLSEPT
jgi:hypothetical protein